MSRNVRGQILTSFRYSELGGAIISQETYDAEQKKVTGSTIVFEADELDDVKAWIEEDLYYTSNVVGFASARSSWTVNLMDKLKSGTRIGSSLLHFCPRVLCLESPL